MVTGFENITHTLSDFEKDIVIPIILKGWSDKVPDQDMIKMGTMISKLNKYCERNNIVLIKKTHSVVYKTNGPRMRQMIHYLRCNGQLKNLVANSKGYYLTNKPQEIEKFVKSCKERANSFIEVANAIYTYNFER